MDPEHFDDPETFNGLRFYRMRQSEGQASKHQLISVSKDDLAWGYGRHACPGRYMAEIAIKLMLAEVLLRYEIKNPEGKPRHPNFEFDGQVSQQAPSRMSVVLTDCRLCLMNRLKS